MGAGGGGAGALRWGGVVLLWSPLWGEGTLVSALHDCVHDVPACMSAYTMVDTCPCPAVVFMTDGAIRRIP